MIFKKKSAVVLIFLSFITVSYADDLDSFESTLFKNSPLLLFDDELFFDTLPTTLTLRISKQEIIDILKEINALSVLQESLYCHTNRLNKRSLLDLPIFEPYCCTSDWTLGGHLFSNQTDFMQFIPDKIQLDSYLALSQSSLLSKLENSIDILKPLFGNGTFDIDIPAIFCLFKRLGVQDRRIGCMFETQRDWTKFKIRTLLPLYYQERNFYLLPRHQQETEEVLGDAFGFSDAQSQERFQSDYLISDRIGLGDLRLEITAPFFNACDFYIDAGAMFTIPTAFTFIRGIVGSDFDAPATLPLFDFDAIIDLANTIINDQAGVPTQEQITTVFDFVQDFMLGSLNRLSANLLETETGNNHHLGVGIMARSYTSLYALFPFDWARHFSFNGRYSIEYLFPATQKWFYAYNLNKAAFRARDFMDDTKADENLAFLEEELIKRFYTVALNTRVQPGFIFRWSSKLCYDRERWGFYIGSDTYIQSKGRLGKIDAPGDVIEQLNIYKARPFHSYQGKIFAGITGKVNRPSRFWLVGINGDTTYTSHGMGKDYTLSFNIEVNF